MPGEDKLNVDLSDVDPETPEKKDEKEEEKVEEKSEEKSDEKTEEKAEEKAEEKVEEAVEDGLEKDEDGFYVLQADPEDPKSTVYKAKTLKGLQEAIAKGLKEKDKYIRELKANKVTSKSEERDFENVSPNQKKILTEVFADYGLDPKMLSWKEDQWRDYESEKGAAIAARMMNKIEAAQLAAQERYDAENVDYLNDTALDEETEQVRELLKDSDIDPDDFDFQDVLAKIHADKTDSKFFYKNGLRKNGVIVKEAAKAIRLLGVSRSEKKIKREVEAKIAEGREKKDRIKSVSTSDKKTKVEDKSPKSIEQASEEILKELRAQK